MSVLLRLTGTFFMFAGFLGCLSGWAFLRMKQEDLGKMFMSTTFLTGGEVPDTPWMRLVTAMHANDAFKNRCAAGMLLGGTLLAVLGAVVAGG